MGFITSATTVTLTAKLTPLGRKKLISNNNKLITKFSLGDSDANYYASQILGAGQIPSAGGTIGSDSGTTNSVTTNVIIKSPLIVDSSGSIKKIVEPQSITITNQFISLGQTTLSASNLSQVVVNRDNNTTDPFVNLFFSFGLPLTTSDDTLYSATTFSRGGFSDTALSAIGTTHKILAIGINDANRGELIDGKQLKVNITTSAGTYVLYSTFQNSNITSNVQDANYIDSSINISQFGSNIALLFSDNIKKPNGGNTSLSWATGFGTTKPFSVNGKQFFNLTSTPALGLSADTVVGIAYLDKGFIILTSPTIVNSFDITTASTATTVVYNSVSTKVSQNIVCVANKGEFAFSTNKTFGGSDTVRISEIGLYDDENNLIAIAKPERHIQKTLNQFIALSIEIGL